jgi:hypothetical protein
MALTSTANMRVARRVQRNDAARARRARFHNRGGTRARGVRRPLPRLLLRPQPGMWHARTRFRNPAVRLLRNRLYTQALNGVYRRTNGDIARHVRAFL